jgi:hypothetical protein
MKLVNQWFFTFQKFKEINNKIHLKGINKVILQA